MTGKQNIETIDKSRESIKCTSSKRKPFWWYTEYQQPKVFTETRSLSTVKVFALEVPLTSWQTLIPQKLCEAPGGIFSFEHSRGALSDMGYRQFLQYSFDDSMKFRKYRQSDQNSCWCKSPFKVFSYLEKAHKIVQQTVLAQRSGSKFLLSVQSSVSQ